jgi:hypothetical protein
VVAVAGLQKGDAGDVVVVVEKTGRVGGGCGGCGGEWQLGVGGSGRG